MESNIILKKFDVSLDASEYEILIGRNILSKISNFLPEKSTDKRVLLVIDSFFEEQVTGQLIGELSSNGYEVHTYLFAAGKQNKNINEAINIYGILESKNFARDSTIIAVGGGVIGDISGFIASTYLRGINLVHVPTTLTAMIDSSIGGKAGINFRKTINAIGSYYHPVLNLIDLQFIDSLSSKDFIAGIAEIIKCAVICDDSLFRFIEDNHKAIMSKNEESLLSICKRAIEIKLDHVRNDIRENNKRLLLNYGHTLGHAIETSTGIFEEVYRHGEGVSLGMIGSAFISENYFNDKADNIVGAHERILSKFGLPVRVDAKKINFNKRELVHECLINVHKDKKRKQNTLRFILPVKIGRCGIYNDVPVELVEEAFDYLIE